MYLAYDHQEFLRCSSKYLCGQYVVVLKNQVFIEVCLQKIPAIITELLFISYAGVRVEVQIPITFSLDVIRVIFFSFGLSRYRVRRSRSLASSIIFGISSKVE